MTAARRLPDSRAARLRLEQGVDTACCPTLGCPGFVTEETGEDRCTEGHKLSHELASEGHQYPLTNFGNADRFVDDHKHDVRHDAASGGWRVWDGRRFALDDGGVVASQRAQSTIREVRTAGEAAEDKGQRQALLRWADKCESAGGIEQILKIARFNPAIVRNPADWDSNPDVLNVLNGTIDLRTGVLKKHDRGDHYTKLVSVPYEPQARCDRWMSFLARVAPDNDVRDFLRIAAGYSLTGHTLEQCLIMLLGTGRNGKSLFIKMMRWLGGEYAVHADFETFLDRPGTVGGARGDIARFYRTRIVTTAEAGEGKRLNEALVKAITGGDTITARHLFSKEIEFPPELTLWMAVNHRPVVHGGGDGLWRRMRLVPFNVQIPDEEDEKNLDEVLRAELPGVLAWAVSGAIQWYRTGLPFPKAVKDATENYREESDVMAEFIDERCTRDPAAQVLAGNLYTAYKHWCEHRGDTPVSNNVFGRKLTDRGIGGEKRGGQKYRTGLKLKPYASGTSSEHFT